MYDSSHLSLASVVDARLTALTANTAGTDTHVLAAGEVRTTGWALMM